jgi:hypothetical protein
MFRSVATKFGLCRCGRIRSPWLESWPVASVGCRWPKFPSDINGRRRANLAAHAATDRLTATWKLSCFPVCRQYWRATPTETHAGIWRHAGGCGSERGSARGYFLGAGRRRSSAGNQLQHPTDESRSKARAAPFTATCKAAAKPWTTRVRG